MEWSFRRSLGHHVNGDPRNMMPVVILAAGSSTRMGTATSAAGKLGTVIAGRSLLAWTIWMCSASPHIILVVHEEQELPSDLPDEGVHTVVAARAADGMGWSLAAGLRAVPDTYPGAVVVLGDDPMAAGMLDYVQQAAQLAPHNVVAVHRPVPTPHPVYLPRSVWKQPDPDTGDQGLRSVLEREPVVWIEDPDGRPIDVDTPDDSARLEAALRRTFDVQ